MLALYCIMCSMWGLLVVRFVLHSHPNSTWYYCLGILAINIVFAPITLLVGILALKDIID